MAAVRHLGFLGGSCWTTHKGTFVVAIPRKIVTHDRLSSVKVIII